MATDALALLSGLILASFVVNGRSGAEEVIHFAPALLVMWLAVFTLCDLYDRAQSRRNFGALLGGILWGAGFLAIGTIMYPQGEFSPKVILLGIPFIILLEGGLRFLYERGIEPIYQRSFGLVPTLIVGSDDERARVRQAMEKSNAYSCVGELNTTGGAVDLPLLRQVLDQTGARSVILAESERVSDEQSLNLLRAMWLRKVQVRVVPDAATLMSSKPAISRDGGMPLLVVGCPRLDGTQWILKRLLDLAGSLGGLMVLSPFLLIMALLIRLDSPGPILFRQKRVGADGKVFTCYKFRSMYEDAEQRQKDLEALNEADGAVFKIKDDPRITPVGRFLRRWSLDELPQLINVVKGEMSLVGPRPLPVRDFMRMEEAHKRRLGAVPGITGYWQISGRSDISFEEMVRLDLYYIENWLLSLDIKILLKTLRVVLRREGAY
jgi:exopolysaccharide biosynthesis polyprenyl glycosylphosphotransferase